MTANSVLVSACLLGEKVRYDGRDNLIESPLLERLKKENRLVPLCPEVLGGLPVPRAYAQIQQRIPVKVINSEDEDVTPEFLLGAELTLETALEHNCVAALMKANSPACGNTDIQGGSFSGRPAVGAGVAAQELIQAGIPVFNETQLDQLEKLLTQLEQYPREQTA